MEHAKLLALIVGDDQRLELLAQVALGAVYSRYLAATRELNKLKRVILESVIRRGRIYISNAMIMANLRFAPAS
jgi:hypothetical protein